MNQISEEEEDQIPEEEEDFWNRVGSKSDGIDEFVEKLKLCSANDFAHNEKTKRIVLFKACDNLQIVRNDEFIDVFCQQCGIVCEGDDAIPINVDSEESEEPVKEGELDDFDEFLDVVGTDI